MQITDSKPLELAKICYLHYRKGMSQREIAEQLGKSNMTISRLLREARKEGIVEFQLNVPYPSNSQVEKRLKDRFPAIEDSIVFDNETLSHTDFKQALGNMAASCIPFFLRNGIHIGVGGGETIAHLVDALGNKSAYEGITVVQLTGITSQAAVLGSEMFSTQRLSSKLNAEGYCCPLPNPFDYKKLNGETDLLEQVSWEARSRWGKIDVGIVGIGQIHNRSLPTRVGYVSSEKLADLESKGSVGDILLHFFDSNGRIVDWDFDATVTGISWEQLKNTDQLIAVAGGQYKVSAIQGALNSGVIDILITDCDTALEILDTYNRRLFSNSER